jgi:subtilase family serine protease
MQTLPKALFAPRNLSCLVLLLAFAGGPARAQTQPFSRITQPIDDNVRVTLSGNVHPLAQPRFDRGPVSDSLPSERMILLLQRSPERVSALRQFLLDLHTQGSPRYHHWLTPEEFGTSYGLADSEVAAVAAWLQQHGFSVARVNKAKNAIEFSGTADQLRRAFNTELRTYVVNGETHHSINRDPQIPAAFAPIVAGITPLNDFRPSPQIRVLGTGKYDPKTHVVQPDWTIQSNPPLLALAPGDFAVQYALNPLYSAGTNGTGVTIGIISASDVLADSITNYRSFFGLPPIILNTVVDGIDPGPSPTVDRGNWAETEAILDVEISGGVAPNATINLYAAADTTVQSGLLLAAQRAVEDNVAAVLTTSYSECESSLGVAGNQFWAALWEQAAAQGQTSFVSSGDNGPAGCDNFNASQAATHGLAVNGFASTPWNVAVGGTDFYYTSYNGTSAAQSAELATYWNTTQTSLTLTPSTSLLKPVPEQPWNRAFGLNLSTGGVYDPTQPTIVAGSGGASSAATATGGYPKPAWQSGKGVPSDGLRDLPDVSLFSADGENHSFYPVCLGFQDCNPSLGLIEVHFAGGTSAASPEMAAIMALINQKYGRQGQANFIFYPLAAQHPSAFHDVTVGSIKVPCSSSFSLGCALSAANDNTKGFDVFGYYAGSGYDQASGLGSVDANLLVQYWNSLTFAPSSTSLNLSQTTFTHGTPVTVNVSVTGSGGTPSGDVGLLTTQTPANASVSLSELTLKTGAASSSVNNFPGGQYQLTARYTGDTVFAPSTSAPLSLNVTPENSTVSVSGSYWNNSTNGFSPIVNGSSFPFGTYFILDAQPLGVNAPKSGADGIPSGTVTFTDTAGSNTVTSSSINIDSQGFAEWQSFLSFPLGASSVSARYSGDASFNASASSTPLTFTITQATTQAFLFANPSPVAVGSPTTLNMSVSNTFSGPPCPNAACTFYPQSPAAPTGTVTFTFGTTTLGTGNSRP